MPIRFFPDWFVLAATICSLISIVMGSPDSPKEMNIQKSFKKCLCMCVGRGGHLRFIAYSWCKNQMLSFLSAHLILLHTFNSTWTNSVQFIWIILCGKNLQSPGLFCRSSRWLRGRWWRWRGHWRGHRRGRYTFSLLTSYFWYLIFNWIVDKVSF